jgi:hypothetical protein
MAGTVTLTGLSAGEPAGERNLGPLSIEGAVVIGETIAVPLSSGDNTFTVPLSAIGVIVIPPSTGTAALTYRTSANSSDAGLPLSPYEPFMHTFSTSPPTSVIVNASSSQASATTLWFW